MQYKIYKYLPDEAKFIRETVFIKEQGFQNEYDHIDETAHHIVLYVDSKAVGTARFFTEDGGKSYHLGRLAVSKECRGNNYGKVIVEAIETEVKKLGGTKIELSAQVQAKDFYAKCGYEQTGDVYLDEHCPHILMFKLL